MTEPSPNETPNEAPRRTTLLWIVKLVVSGGLLYLLLSQVDLGRLWETARSASPAWLAIALALYFGMIVVSAWRWALLLEAQHISLGLGRLTRSFLVATFFNNFLPSNIGGDVVRIRDTAPAAGSKTLATTIVFLDRGIGLLGLLFLAAVGTSLTAGDGAAGPVGAGLLWLIFAASLAVAVPVLLFPQRVGQILTPLRRLHQDWVELRIQRLTSALARFREAPAALVSCFAGAVAVQMILVAFYAAIARGLGIPIPLSHLAVLVPVSFVVQMLPVSVNGFGVREATFSFYFTRIGLALESALALSFLGAVLIMAFSLSGAVVLMTSRKR